MDENECHLNLMEKTLLLWITKSIFMMTYRKPTHPGKGLKYDVLEHLKMTVAEADEH